jgi:hypothetical protein
VPDGLGEPAGDVDAGDRRPALAAQPGLGVLVAGGVDGVAGGVRGRLDQRPAQVLRAVRGRFDYQVQPPTLTMRFIYDDPQWSPPEACATPVVVLRFSDVQVWQWEDDYDLFESPVAERGQVRALDYYAPTNVFSLLTLNTRLLFSARRLMVELQPGGHPMK